MKEIKKEEINNNAIFDRNMRDKCVRHYEVLKKVKELLLIPGTEFATITDIADFYEVGTEPIQKLYQRNKLEIDMDGIRLISAKELIGHQCPISQSFSKNQYKTIVTYDNGRIVEIPNRGIKVFPKRAILRMGMMLQKSKVASEVRTQLLNIEEKVESEVKTHDIKEEQKLMLEVGMAYASGDTNAVMIATTKMMEFKNRHIAKLENDNKVLAGEILLWSDRKKLNAGVRQLSAVTGISFGNMWNELYKNLQYKYGICVKQRGGTPYLQWIENTSGRVLLKHSVQCVKHTNNCPQKCSNKLLRKLLWRANDAWNILHIWPVVVKGYWLILGIADKKQVYLFYVSQVKRSSSKENC